jgi:hypothetical protein
MSEQASTLRTRASLRALAPWALFAAWCTVTLVTVFHHEPWRDEADTWLVARDLSLGDIWKLAPYVGTPILWHLLEVPFAKLGFAYGWQEALHWPIAACVAAVITFRSPFSLLTRALLLFSYWFLYEYTVVARCYALTNLFIVLACLLYAKRREGSVALALVVAGAANSSPFGTFFACAWQAAMALDLVVAWRSKQLTRDAMLGWVVASAGVLLAIAQLMPRPHDGQLVDAGANIHGLARAFERGEWAYGPSDVKQVFAFACLAATIFVARKSWRGLAVYAFFCAFLCYCFGSLHLGFARHWGYFLVAGVVARWLALVDEGAPEFSGVRSTKPLAIAKLVALVLLCVQLGAWDVAGVDMATADMKMRFTNAPAMVDWITRHHLETRTIAAHPPPIGEALLPFLPDERFYYPALERTGTNMPWNRKLERDTGLPVALMFERVKRDYPEWSRDGVLFLTHKRIDPDVLASEGYRALHEENAPVCSTNGEHLFLYEPIPAE